MPSFDKELRKTAASLVLVILVVWAFCLFAQQIDLTSSDLGRHLKNGELILLGTAAERHAVLTENFYSYTEPQTPFVNHHWGTGVLFYLVERAAGFTGLSFFFLILFGLALFFAFDLARRESSFFVAATLLFSFLPLLAVRSEVRPEVFSYLFSVFFIWLLRRVQNREISARCLLLLPVLQMLWVNLHIGFLFGPFIVGVFLFSELVSTRTLWSSALKRLAFLFVGVSVASLLNPAGLTGALYPFRVFSGYGYRVLENQSVRFLEGLHLQTGYDFLLFKVIACSFTVLVLWGVIRRRLLPPLPLILLAVVFGGLATSGVRNFPLFALSLLPALAALWRVASEDHKEIAAGLLVALCVLGAVRGERLFGLRHNSFGVGLTEGSNRAGEFLKTQGIQGNIFNNYDIGGYLIYYLAPWQKVFTDNRPEAYSVDFFSQTYIPSQEDSKKFDALDRQFHFTAIIFNYRDATPWGQTFLHRIISDSRFARVFADERVIILQRRAIQ